MPDGCGIGGKYRLRDRGGRIFARNDPWQLQNITRIVFPINYKQKRNCLYYRQLRGKNKWSGRASSYYRYNSCCDPVAPFGREDCAESVILPTERP